MARNGLTAEAAETAGFFSWGSNDHGYAGRRRRCGARRPQPATGAEKKMSCKLFPQKNLCVLSVLGGESRIGSSISIRVILIGPAVGRRKRIGASALRRFRGPGISDRVILLSAY